LDKFSDLPFSLSPPPPSPSLLLPLLAKLTLDNQNITYELSMLREISLKTIKSQDWITNEDIEALFEQCGLFKILANCASIN
jgi:hypothetical protein